MGNAEELVLYIVLFMIADLLLSLSILFVLNGFIVTLNTVLAISAIAVIVFFMWKILYDIYLLRCPFCGEGSMIYKFGITKKRPVYECNHCKKRMVLFQEYHEDEYRKHKECDDNIVVKSDDFESHFDIND